ncbi:exodeoxyribonuclease VII large subunit [Cocleimonas sp. KMM 6892]|uniref:exodeoxyribonuclease VII large subunit n=1 Tax=unclassified Cocleimonas TaxID=2639732 RepID=UPI002DB63697|nr:MULTISPECIES: exodeoxyribonuclease VII large subunit [unclassified Cocleimonas]MEB8432093.1 exodeoxyribonuclease VII large subunit [Cocleimonas sp. KMM 6892]MEC4714821.1 exodeoxyribonuclease VII large subunit [Cocleimonas sp. KMM 6895]MEC4744365.1 exodeoxyribonuclease VII large subunit [Cocleimonas sp. KMM 6896]
MLTNNRTILSVAELNAEVNQLLTRGFPLLWVEGEISNLVRPSSGHLYFTLKDKKSQIRSAMFRNRNMKLSIKPENGMKVLVRGRVGLYEPRGDYQFIAEHMEDAGVGQLQKQFEQLKQKLSTAGLFADEHKKDLPEYPKRIGIITSPTGAAIRDILNVLQRRSPQTPILIYPVAVQGEASKLEIETAIRRADTDNKCDVIILARGGGSIEDLWSFNEENVAKAIYNANTPIVCGVGHEIDFTIADFVADLRAPTPSAAAELITPDRNQLYTDVMQTTLWLEERMKREISSRQQHLSWLQSRLALQKPSQKIQQQYQRLDEVESRLHQQLNKLLEQKKARITYLDTRLRATLPHKKIQQQKQQVDHLQSRLYQSMQTKLTKSRSLFQLQMTTLDNISPLKTLDRGYAIVKNKDTNDLITSVKQTKDVKTITVTLKDGEFNANLTP